MRSKTKILEKKSLHMGYFLGIPLLVRVKIPILRDTPKNIPLERIFFKDQGPLFRDKGGFKIWKY
jgi:hypothetical protein